MNINNKCLEYYMDSKTYSNEEIQKSIDNTKKEFSNKNVKVNIKLNEFGVYIITFSFENKNTFFNRIKLIFKRKEKTKRLMIEEKSINNIKSTNLPTKKNKEDKKQEKIKKRFEKYSKNNGYGKYKTTGIYKPY